MSLADNDVEPAAVKNRGELVERIDRRDAIPATIEHRFHFPCDRGVRRRIRVDHDRCRASILRALVTRPPTANEELVAAGEKITGHKKRQTASRHTRRHFMTSSVLFDWSLSRGVTSRNADATNDRAEAGVPANRIPHPIHLQEDEPGDFSARARSSAANA